MSALRTVRRHSPERRDARMTRGSDASLGATPSPAPLNRRAFLAGAAGGAALALTGCSMGTKQMFTGGSSGTTIAVAIVSNSQMQDAISLSHLFESEHPNRWDRLMASCICE